jgi:AAA family ATP:ADP antiporter
VYISLIPLGLFFVVFAFILYPNRDFLHPSTERLLQLQEAWPHFKWWLAIWGNWIYSLFFLASELCGTISMSLFFWQFANAICDRNEAKRFYPLFGVIGNLGLILAGKLTEYYSNYSLESEIAEAENWTYAIQVMLVTIQLFYYWLNRSLAKHPIVGPRLAQSSGMPKRPRSSLTQSLKHVLSSPHLFYIALLVFSYGLTINFCDVLWKSEVKSFFKSNPAGYSAFMGHFSVTIGLLTIPLMLISSHLLRRISWISAAILPPLIMLVAGIGFFAGIFWGLWEGPTSQWIIAGGAITPLWLAVHFGFWQNALSKASKYSLFDPTKEMAYIPLDEEVKIKGKAAVDVVGARFGKTGGSLTFFLLQTFLPQLSLQELSPFIFAIFILALIIWLTALNKLQPLLNTSSTCE